MVPWIRTISVTVTMGMALLSIGCASNSEMEATKAHLATLEGKVDSLSTELVSARVALSAAGQEMAGLNTRLASAERGVSGLSDAMSATKDDVSNLSEGLQSFRFVAGQDVASLRARLASTEKGVSGLSDAMSATRGDVGTLGKGLATVRSSTDQGITALEARLASTERGLIVLNDAGSITKGDLSNLGEGLNSFRSAAEQDMATLKARISYAEQGVSGLASTMSATRGDVSNLTDAVVAIRGNVNSLSQGLATFRATLADVLGLPQEIFTGGTMNGFVTLDNLTVQGGDDALSVVGCTGWYIGPVMRNRVCGGTVNFGDEVIHGRPEDLWLDNYRERMQAANLAASMYAMFSDICWDCSPEEAQYKVNLLLVDGEGQATPQIIGLHGQQGPYQDNWRLGVWNDRVCFAPPDGGKSPEVFDACVSRAENGDLIFVGNGKAVSLSEIAALLGK
ncbi:MAG: hypothetical protein HY531_02005 [Chloroflexi bacterium]|nr:hypothetical protein [Chloroflexota bacterium]